ncbi:hypothetical protein F9C07_1162074 [Aspergillus flavus]|uniref:Uncharacterized protein n=1 Tax=Aspergillus flavus (strain ATCC 200026 / FGSC A1120 / IAM 13836 / NRRL 3357 / JCM 12722 / SRRC 167) TaxID=332952 RepID=A0A7U2MSN8_ASPFN|nr:hypothetical protein F9C07_1162074 [Aspergillus flavus]
MEISSSSLGFSFLFFFHFFGIFFFCRFLFFSRTSMGIFLGYHEAKKTFDRSFSYLLFPHGLDNGKPPNGLLAVVVHALRCTVKSLSPGIRQPGITLAASTAISIWAGTLILGSNNIHSASRRSGHMYVWKRVKLQISIPPDLISFFFLFSPIAALWVVMFHVRLFLRQLRVDR